MKNLISIGLFFLGLSIAYGGFVDARIAFKHSVPTEMECGDFLKATEKPLWVKVKGCVIDYGSITMTKNGFIVYAPILPHPLKDAQTTSVVITVEGKEAFKIDERLTEYNKLIDEHNADGPGLNEARRTVILKKLSDLEREIHSVGDHVLKLSTGVSEISLRDKRIREDYALFEPSTMEDKPSTLLAWLELFGGLLLSGVSAIFLLLI